MIPARMTLLTAALLTQCVVNSAPTTLLSGLILGSAAALPITIGVGAALAPLPEPPTA